MEDVSFFFFQAEDGIRDGRVTGVQTCALPISAPGPRGGRRPPRPRGPAPGRAERAAGAARWRRPPAGRSEERRVGKGVDLGGRRIIQKKKKKNHERHTLNQSRQTTASSP